MSTYTAIIGDTSSVGIAGTSAAAFPARSPVSNPYPHRNPQLAAARIRAVQNPHCVFSAVGGMISADFTIPAWEAQKWRPLLRYGAAVWLFDGATPIFMGWAEQPVWTQTGDCQMTINGPWATLGSSRMREAWELWDMTLLNPGTANAENTAAQVHLGNNGSLRLAFGTGSAVAASDRVSVEYLLFGEVVGSFDGKLITAFEFDISDNAFNVFSNLRFRVVGCSSPGAVGTTLYDTNSLGSSGRQGAMNLAGVNQSGIWGVHGYRCLRFQLIASGGAITGGVNSYVTLDRIRISTREAVFPTVGNSMDVAAVASDIFAIKANVGSAGLFDTTSEFWPSETIAGSPDVNTNSYFWGLDPRTASAPASGVGITGFTALEWQSPADILADLAAISGSHIGFYLPYNGRSGYDAPGNALAPDVGSYWLSAPPNLYVQPFPDPVYAPDYTIQTREGALVTPSADAQPLIDLLYVNYQTLQGRQLSVVDLDADIRNYTYAQGFRRSDDYSIQPSVGDATLASALGQQQLSSRRQPSTSTVLTITNDGSARYPILHQGCAVPKLALVRPGSVQITDVAASSGLRHGYATDVEWWGQGYGGVGSDETLQITFGVPGAVQKLRVRGHLARRFHRERRRRL